MSWVRERLKRTLPREPWREREEQFAKRLKTAAEHVNARFDVRGLCKEMPERMRLLVHACACVRERACEREQGQAR